MKKIVLIVLLAMLIPTIAFTQISLGVKGGFPVSFMHGEDWNKILDIRNETNSEVFGVTAGLFSIIKINEIFSVQGEISYSSFGGGSKGMMWGYTYTDKYTANLIDIPVLLKYNLPAGKGIFNLFAGPEIMVAFGDMKRKIIVDGHTTKVEGKIKKNTVALGISVGIGYSLPLPNKTFLIFDTRYRTSLTTFTTGDNFLINFGSVILTAGYGFKF